MKMQHFLTMQDGTEIFTNAEGSYVSFVSNLDICNDGSGPAHGDPSYQPRTAYTPALNADVDKYIVTPPQVRKGVPPVVMGCLGRVTCLSIPSQWSWGVVGDSGPDDKAGECSYCLAKIISPRITYNTGDGRFIFLYEFWPGIAAVVDGKNYRLIPAG